MPAGYIVTRPFPDSNVGSNLSSLAGALLFAQRLGRRLVVDWRGMAQLQDKTINYFAEFFEAPPTLLSVGTLYAPVSGAEYSRDTGAPWLNANAAAAALRGELDLDEHEFVVLEQYHGTDRLLAHPESDRFTFLRQFYREVRPGAELRDAVESWAKEQLGGRFAVGVNVRTGNGHYFGTGQPYAGRVDVEVLADGERLLRRLERAVAQMARRLPRPVRSATVAFCATDSQPMSELLSTLPGAVTRRRTYPPANAGDLHAFEGTPGQDRASVVDTLADMFLLAYCDALVYNNSLFNQYARIVTGYFGGNLAHIDTLFFTRRIRMAATAVRPRLAR